MHHVAIDLGSRKSQFCMRSADGVVLKQGKIATNSLRELVRELLTSSPSGLSQHLERLLLTLESINKQIAAADKELKKMAETDEVTRRLMTTPGVGPQTAIRFVAAVDDVKRFSSAQALSSYFGLTPGENSSGQRERMTGITKAGDSGVRFCLVQAAWTVLRKPPETDMGRWARQLAERRNSSIAVVGLARKLSGILYALWRDGTTFEASAGKEEPLSS